MAPTREDAALRSAFLAAWARDDGVDQWWWVQHPGTTAPSGTPSWEQRLAAARAPLYRRDADPAARTAFERLEADAAEEREAVRRALAAIRTPPPAVTTPEPPAHRSRRWVVIAGAVAAAGVVGAGAAAALSRSAAAHPLQIRAAPLQVAGDELLRLQILFAAAQAAPQLHAAALRRRLQHDVDDLDPRALARTTWTTGSVLYRAPAPPGGGGADASDPGVSAAEVRVGGLATGDASADIADTTGGVVSVVVMTARPGGWTLELDVEGGPAIRVQGATDRAAPQFAVTRLGDGARLSRAAVLGPRAVPFVWNVTVRA